MKPVICLILSLWVLLLGTAEEAIAELEMVHSIKALMGYVHSQQQPPEEEWWTFSMMGARVGYMYSRIEEGTYEGEEILKEYSEVVIEMDREGISFRMVTTTLYYWTPDWTLRYFLETTDENGEKTTVEGKVEGSVLIVRTTLAGVTMEEEYTLQEGTVFLQRALEDAFAERGLTVGDRFTVQGFDVDFLKVVDMSVEILMEETITYQGEDKRVVVVNYTMEGLTITSWVTPDGEVYKQDVMGIMTIIRTSKEEALSAIEDFDVMVSSRVPVIGELSPFGTPSLTVKVTLTEGDVLSTFPETERQKVTANAGASEGFLRICMIEITESDALSLPIQAAEFSDYLKPTVYVQSDDPQIQQQARKILGEENNAWAAAKKLCTWVYQNIKEKNYSVGFASAKQTLESLEGDCTEHTVLFAALARAVGIPTKLCDGIVPGYDGFGYYHAWAKVYVGKWVAVDPTWNQYQADAAHIQLGEAIGTETSLLEMSIGVLRVMGKLTIEVWDEDVVAVVEMETDALPTAYVLYPNMPNPFNPSTLIRYTLPKAGYVELTLYNTLGQIVEHLVSHTQPAGYHAVIWKAKDRSSGIYFYRLKVGSFIETRKALLVR